MGNLKDGRLPKDEQQLLDCYPGPIGRMLELGCKGFGSYKAHFTALGWEHVSVDLNGLGGALALDLTEPGVLAPLGAFDLVTNFGTTEHVPKQEPCWRNAHEALKPGGCLISTTPRPTFWCEHGRYYPHPHWYAEFAKRNHYEMILLDISERTQMVRAVLRKGLTGPAAYEHPPGVLMYINHHGPKVGAYEK